MTARPLVFALVWTATQALADEPAPPPPNYLEVRAGFSDAGLYRYAEYARPLAGPVVFDAVYLGLAGANELYVGAGYAFKPTPTLTVTPLVYGVVGSEDGQRGVALGLGVLGSVADWSVYTFIGYFEPLAGDVARYLFVDTLDVSRKRGRWEFGGSAGVFATGGGCTCLAGPLLVRNDRLGAWRASLRAGSMLEVRLVRTFAF
jgi:hypothetical protein